MVRNRLLSDTGNSDSRSLIWPVDYEVENQIIFFDPANKSQAMKNKTFKQTYSKWAKATAEIAGSSHVFMGAISIVLIWAISGPFFDFSETWQLVINTGTTIITFLMIFLIQNTQNRDTEAIQVKLEELIRVSSKARNQLIDMEEKDEEEIRKIREDIWLSARKGCEPERGASTR